LFALYTPPDSCYLQRDVAMLRLRLLNVLSICCARLCYGYEQAVYCHDLRANWAKEAV